MVIGKTNVTDTDAHSIYIGTKQEWFGVARQWAVDNGFARHDIRVQGTKTRFGLSDGGGVLRQDLVSRCFAELRNRQRENWPQAARDTCSRVERKLYEIFELLDETTDAKEKLEIEVGRLTPALVKAKRVAEDAEQTAADARSRARSSAPDRIRREVEAENAARMAQLEQANQALVAKLAEATSLTSKLAEDKKRLRAALNGARAR